MKFTGNGRCVWSTTLHEDVDKREELQIQGNHRILQNSLGLSGNLVGSCG